LAAYHFQLPGNINVHLHTCT